MPLKTALATRLSPKFEPDVQLLAELAELVGELVEVGPHRVAERQEVLVDLIGCRDRFVLGVAVASPAAAGCRSTGVAMMAPAATAATAAAAS
ncbi:hypothetical protein [Mycobacterium sp. NAZ190054]|uniref:hypothetical protein n=1 Tax=Mycobacterium sp. NAZ190054 TaxID=1747766 RepID=UPI0012E3A3EF|nr:hypothetical protein [Mycobacterium sp. NAZ190054]